MDKAEATLLITSNDAHERLLAARFFSNAAGTDDVGLLKGALEREDVAWIRNALDKALKQAKGIERIVPPSYDEFDVSEEEFANQVYANAVEDTTRRLIHEIEPTLGLLRLAARAEITDHDNSQTWALLNRQDDLLSAIGNLSRSARAPHNREFDVGELIKRTCDDEKIGHDVRIDLSGRKPFIVVGDPDLVCLALRNGVRNAIEATEEVELSARESIVVTWDGTKDEMWIVVLDRGIWIAKGAKQVWEIGVSSKKGHLGIGLAIALTAVRSMAGEVSLTPREGKGTAFEIRWPIITRKKNENPAG